MKQRQTPHAAHLPEINELAIGPNHCCRSVPCVFSFVKGLKNEHRGANIKYYITILEWPVSISKWQLRTYVRNMQFYPHSIH